MTKTARWQSDAANLMQAARDVRLEPEQLYVPSNAGREHRLLLDSYVQDLRRAKAWAKSWWTGMIETEQKRAGSRAEAIRTVRMKYPVGDVAHGSVIAVVRDYWLRCVELNEAVSPSSQMPPEEFLLGSLLRPPLEELAQFLSALPYWPIGINASGKWA